MKKQADFSAPKEQRQAQYALLQRYLAGEPEVGELLFPLLIHYMQRHLPSYIQRRNWWLSREDVEEAIFTALGNCSKNFSTRGDALLTSWAFCYAIHAAGNLHIKNCRYRRHFDCSADIASLCTLHAEDNPLDLLILWERNNALYRAFFHLDVLSREVVFYRVLEEKSLHAVSRKLKISKKLAEICLSRALFKLKNDFHRFYHHPYSHRTAGLFNGPDKNQD